MSKFDIIIPIAKTDIGALKNSLPYIKSQLPDAKIVVIANIEVEKLLADVNDISFIDENKMIDGLDFKTIKSIIGKRYEKAERRTGWYFQQFLKLGYSRICDNDYYLSWDSDTIPLTGLEFFDTNGRPFLDVLPIVAEDAAYTKTINNLWNDGSVKKYMKFSFISEHMMFSTSAVNEMLNEIESNADLAGEHFYEKILNAIPLNELNLSGFSEFETYAAYVLSKKKSLYVLRDWKNLRHGRAYFGSNPTEKQLLWVSKSFDVISIEDFDKQLLLCKLLCRDLLISKVKFCNFCKLIEPYIKIKYSIRMIIRKIVRR